MNEEIEDGLVTYLDTLAAFDGAALRKGASAESGEAEKSTVIAAVEDCEHVIGELYKATVTFEIRTHALADGARTTHATLTSALVDVLEDNIAALTTAFNTASPHALRGVKISRQVNSQDNDRFVTRIDATMGIAKDTAS